ncbi:hypothetical protein [Staphylococcus phage vB_SepM_ phiIPLA-C1C]|jgi:hypothetical protein sfi11p52|uniref:DUF7448 domain-containing protein n=5 Tax=Caudoviricetes TaxID=2731619 RepID=A0A0D3MVN6_9CAUD|nr:hypothetical protein AVU40_gp128 [Staphylococcus phage phiIPLA-C1C]ASN67920.1 hypothetical protein 7AX1_90 [uncultured Caudovirales phage]QLF86927.1 hypothetical protein BESEP4_00193 [Staphylococcus phage vB_SepM_BE04]QLF87108.1 hypothetical protein BESEP5_00166 [Staphylococcus phage vB_SepM_BE05]QLF87316.1 hypothetical protein BESEP6_00162 [Staphylococcus phage vB_SepM_BE06]QLF87387.1 hypothetical protein BESEP7_00039 [Staphylococcus phage vB_SepM_BE07]QLF87671.1 hypothetical protein BESE
MYKINYKEFKEIKKQLLYKKVKEWTDKTLTLDDGTLVEIVESEQDCCASAGGEWTNVKLDAVITNVKIENEREQQKFDTWSAESESLATVVLYHNQNPIAQGECYADAGNGDFYYSICSLKIKDIHYPVVKH